MTTPDLINGTFELGGGIVLWLNVRRLLRDKLVRGVHWGPFAFFFLWGLWNLFYYHHLHQYASWVAGMLVPLANGAWLALAFYYKWRWRNFDVHTVPYTTATPKERR